MKPVLFAIMLSTIMLPHHVVLIPQYILFDWLGWVDTFLPLIIPKFLAMDAFLSSSLSSLYAVYRVS